MSGPAATGSGSVRLRLDLGYDGTDFAGWAVQPGRRTVEGALTEALSLVLRLPGVRLTVAGRTDAGVHATGQVVHVDVPVGHWHAFIGRSTRTREVDLLRRLAGVLPPDVRVHRVSEAPPGFEARFSAVARRYAYRVSDDPAGPPPLRRRDVLAYRRPLDVEAMDAAARTLVGLNDFAAFCKRRDGATTVRTLLTYRWSRVSDEMRDDASSPPAVTPPDMGQPAAQGIPLAGLLPHAATSPPAQDVLPAGLLPHAAVSPPGQDVPPTLLPPLAGESPPAPGIRSTLVPPHAVASPPAGGGGLLVATVVADAFCHSMVRALVGVVLAVGEGRRPVEWPAEVLTARAKHPAVKVVPAHGLVLEHVEYPPPEELAVRAREARAVRTL